MAKTETGCSCGCSQSRWGVSGSTLRTIFAGAFGGIVAVVVVGFVAVTVLRRLMPRMMPRMMERMMRDCGCSAEMQACMEKCGCGPSAEDRAET